VSLPHRVAEQRTHDERRLLEILQGLEQRHDVEAGEGGLARQVHEATFARQQQHAKHVIRDRVRETM